MSLEFYQKSSFDDPRKLNALHVRCLCFLLSAQLIQIRRQWFYSQKLLSQSLGYLQTSPKLFAAMDIATKQCLT